MTEIDKVIYTAETHTSGGREGGVSRSSDRQLDVNFSRPGAPGSGTNPEQLFAAGWSACFISAMRIAAGKMKVALPADLAIDAEVDVGTTRDAFGLAARLKISLPGMEREVAGLVAAGGCGRRHHRGAGLRHSRRGLHAPLLCQFDGEYS